MHARIEVATAAVMASQVSDTRSTSTTSSSNAVLNEFIDISDYVSVDSSLWSAALR